MGISQSKFNLALSDTLESLKSLIPGIHETLNAQYSANFKQWHDFNNDDVIHLHIQYLEWLNGSMYRLRTKHVFLLYNFEVNKTELKDTHKQALNAFNALTLGVHFLERKGKLNFPRDFHNFESPFAVNTSKSQKVEIITKQPWYPETMASQLNVIHSLESLNYLGSGNTLKAPFTKLNSFFPRMDDQMSLEPISQAIYQSMAPQSQMPLPTAYQPFLIDNLLYLGVPKTGSSYPFSSVVGRASQTGDEPNNKILKEERAQHVVDHLHDALEMTCNKFEDLTIELKSNVTQDIGNILINTPTQGTRENDFNRSVSFSYEMKHDYINILDESKLKARYKSKINAINTKLKNRITNAELCLSTNSLDDFVPSSLEIPDNNALIKEMEFDDLHYGMGSNVLAFSKFYNGNFKNLIDDAKAFDTMPNRFNRSMLSWDGPEGLTSARFNGLPIPFILSHGTYSEQRNDHYKLPINPDYKLSKVVKPMGNFMKDLSAQVFTSVLDNLIPNFSTDYHGLDKMAKVISNDYKKYVSQNSIRAYSFLMSKMSKSEFIGAINNQELTIKITIPDEWPYNKHDDVEVDMLYYDLESAIIENAIPSYNNQLYWYNQDVLNFQNQQKRKLLFNVIKTDILNNESLFSYQFFSLARSSGYPPRTYYLLNLDWILPQ